MYIFPTESHSHGPNPPKASNASSDKRRGGFWTVAFSLKTRYNIGMATKCARCGAEDKPLHLSNNYCKECMRAYNRERYLARKAGTLAPSSTTRVRFGSVTKTLDPSHEYIFIDGHWEEYDYNTHGTLVGVNIIEKDFDEAIWDRCWGRLTRNTHIYESYI